MIMHYHALVCAQIAPVATAPDEDEKVREMMDKLEAENREGLMASVVRDLSLRRLRALENAFSRAVVRSAENIMAPYGCNNEEYYEFWDRTEEVEEGYKNDKEIAIRLPDGTVVSSCDERVRNRFVILDGKVYENSAGKLQIPKRTHVAKKMKAVSCLVRKLYSLAEYAELYYGAEYNEDEGGYGISSNPNAFYDWFEVGGRWPREFLVKDTCEEYSLGEYDPRYDDAEVPSGYRWVCAARKGDIEWNAMYDFRVGQARKLFADLEAMFVYKTMTPAPGMAVWNSEVSHNGILCYVIGETEDSYLKRCGVKDLQYYFTCNDLIDENGLESYESFATEKKEKQDREAAWDEHVQNYIRDLDDETVLISVDYHI